VKFLDSAFKHGLDESTITRILANPSFLRQHPDPSVSLLAGFDENGDLIEVAYDMVERIVFHAMRVDAKDIRSSK
jgi:hypothetical protein